MAGVLCRLILLLLVACLALPATAAMPCHDGGATAMTMTAGDHAPQTDHRGTAAHFCIGCIPPTSWRSAAVAAPLPAPGTAPVAVPAGLDPGGAVLPAIPPPRPAA